MTQCCQVSSVSLSAGQLIGRGAGCLLLDDQFTKTGRPVPEVLWEKHLDMRVPLVENTACPAFEEYGEVPETVRLDFL